VDNEIIIEWLGRWGKDWVGFKEAYDMLLGNVGFLEREGFIERDTENPLNLLHYRLTDKAINKLKGVDNGDNTRDKT
jgi:hypothetical protein